MKSQTELLKLWIEALRSDKYTQGKDNLYSVDKDGSKLCCLGVLCEVAGIRRLRKADVYLYEYEGEFICQSCLPPELARHMNMFGTLGESCSGKYSSLSYINDKTEMTFKEIADMLEKTPELYFKP